MLKKGCLVDMKAKKERGMGNLIPQERIESKILLIRGKKIMLDRDLAELYSVSTKVLNQAVKRNKKRFPDGFMMQLNKKEKEELVTICDRFNRLKHSSALPYAFTEYGILMLSSVLNSEKAIQINIQIIRVFTKLREVLATHREMARKIEEHDKNIKILFNAVQQLMNPPQVRAIGFKP